jgi:drug/metabolite transporter (DMT)-like permease
VGLILAKQGLSGDFPSISGLSIRMLVSALVIWGITIFRGQARHTFQGILDRSTFGFLLGGSLVGPFLGVWLSIVSIQLAPIGIASTLMSLSPLFLIPAGLLIFHERVSPRAIFGTLVSLCGIVILFLL